MPRRSSLFLSDKTTPLSLSSLKRIREYPNVTLNGPLVPQELHVSPIDPDLAFLALLLVFVAAERCEAPVLGDDDLLAAGEFVLGATEGFDGRSAVCDTFQSVHPSFHWDYRAEWGGTYGCRESEQRVGSGRYSHERRFRWACPMHHASRSVAYRHRHRTTSC